MLKSISYWSFAGGLENTATYPEVFKKAKDLGYEAVECGMSESGVLTGKSTKKDCEKIRKAADDAGIKIASVASGDYWTYSLSASSEDERKKAIENTKALLRVASWLGTDGVLVIPGAVDVFFNPEHEIVSYDVVWENCTESVKQCVADAEKLGVSMCLENVWNKFLPSPLEFKNFVDQFGSERVKVYFDVGNCIPFGYPQQWIRILGKRVGRIHMKDYKWRFLDDANANPGFKGFAEGQQWATMGAFCDLGAGDVNWPETIAALKEVGYDGPLTGEMLPPSDALLKRTSEAMDKIMGR